VDLFIWKIGYDNDYNNDKIKTSKINSEENILITKKPASNVYQYFDTDNLYKQALELWENSRRENFSGTIRKYSEKEKKINQKAILEFIEKIKKSKNKDKLKKILKDFVLKGPIFSQDGVKIFKDPEFFKSTESFLRQVRDYDSEISKEDIGQAFRNVWIMNLLQKSFKIPVVCTDGVFGYSMLYPYTDNYMDDLKIKREEKYIFCKRLDRRLSGYNERAVGKYEEKIFDMVKKIEGYFPREKYPQIYESLLYIHHSQKESLRQQSSATLDSKNENKSKYKLYLVKEPLEKELQKKELQEIDFKKMILETNLLKISFHKGGASVLADGYLVKGNLTQEEKIFCFNYGVLLQLADDLQDCKEDYHNGHMTVFSAEYGDKKLDNRAKQLMCFAKKVFESYFKNKNAEEMKNLLIENTLLLIFGSALMNTSCFSENFILFAETNFPVSKKFLEEVSVRPFAGLSSELEF